MWKLHVRSKVVAAKCLFVYFINLQKENIKKESQSEPNKNNDEKICRNGWGYLQYKMADYIFFEHFQSKYKMHNIFMIMNCKKTYFSWKNLKENAAKQLT